LRPARAAFRYIATTSGSTEARGPERARLIHTSVAIATD
jgi:hypothetical protein